ncbi:MAG TPA: DUF1178 family protein [Burkholderiaceae bacterium]|nr:DUF1178 family protein [Burkholderiaceae bacterium]
MKVFDLCCDADHLFEGWFASQEEFDAQLHARKIGCPLCGSALVRRRPSASRLNLGSPAPVAGAAAAPAEARGPSHLQAAFVQAALHVIATTEDVGERFAEEARRIHYKEVPERGIRGVATRAEAQALEQEGVRIMALPLPDLAKETLH